MGPYEIVAPVGAGGMGEVYRARDTRLGRDVAVKVLPVEFAADPERLRRFEQEARAAAALNHPNILVLHDIGSASIALEGVGEGLAPSRAGTSPAPTKAEAAAGQRTVHYLVTELLEGQTLGERIRSGDLTVAKAVELGIQIAQGLAAAHEHGIVHRDLKPGNVFVTKDGVVKILDFGLARLTHLEAGPWDPATASTETGLTGAHTVLGTVGYMAPEQVRGLPADHRSDIFSFGCVLYEMLACERAFRGDSSPDVAAAILKDDPPSLPTSVPATLDKVVRRCLEKRPEERFFSARDVAFALEAITGETEPPATTLPVQSWFTRHRLAMAGVGTVAAIVAALTIWQPWRAVSRSAASAAEHVPSILALPCQVYGAPEVAFLTDAVPGTISTLLAQVEGLDTKVPPSSFEVEKVKGDLGRLAQLYQVSSFIVTSISTSAVGYALNVQLVDAATRKVRWARQYEGPREAYNELAQQAAEGIRQTVRPAAPPIPTSSVSSEVELAFRQGRYYFVRYHNLWHLADFDAALAAFTRAFALDPSFAMAAGNIAELFVFRLVVEGDVHDYRKQAESWARRALGVDPRCGEAWAALSQVEMSTTHADLERVTDYAVKAVTFAPRDAWVHRNLGIWMPTGSLGLAALLRSIDLDPFFLISACNASYYMCLLERPEDALAVIDRGLELESDWLCGSIARGFVLRKLGRLEEAASTLRRCEAAANAEGLPRNDWRQHRFALAVAQGDTATSETLARQILASVFDNRADATLVGNAACSVVPSLAHMGRTDDAIRILEKSVEVGWPPPYDWLLVEPDIQLLRGDTRFAKVLSACRDWAAMTARVLGEARARGELPAYLEQPLDELQGLLNKEGGAT